MAFVLWSEQSPSPGSIKPVPGMEFFRLLLVVLLMGSMWSAVNGQATYTTSKHHCFYCPRGTYVREHCQEDLTNSTCDPCPQFHFSDQPNSQTFCRRCKLSCPKQSKTVTDCTKVTNRKCECEYGYHQHPLDAIDDQWKCEPHTKCSKGEGEVRYGNHTHDTKCEVCQAGEFVNQTDPKHPRCQASQGNVTQQVVPVDDTTTAPLSTSDAAKDKQRLSEGAIAGIIVAVIGGVIILIAVVVLILNRHRLLEWYRNKRGGTDPRTADPEAAQPMNEQSQAPDSQPNGVDSLGNRERVALEENNTDDL